MNHLPVPNIEKCGVTEDDTEERNLLWEQMRNPENPVHKQIVPFTIKWLVGLPPKKRPLLLASHFPRIANMLAVAWGVRAERQKIVEDLLWDRRGDRKGFPAPIYLELQTLYDYLGGFLAAEETDAPPRVLEDQADIKNP